MRSQDVSRQTVLPGRKSKFQRKEPRELKVNYRTTETGKNWNVKDRESCKEGNNQKCRRMNGSILNKIKLMYNLNT